MSLIHNRQSVVPVNDRLDSWKSIAEYLQRNVRTVQRWHTNNGLPVHHTPGNGSIFAYRTEVDAWLTSGSIIDSSMAINTDLVSSIRCSSPLRDSILSKALNLWECRSDVNLSNIIELTKAAINDNPQDADAYGLLACETTWSIYVDVEPASLAFIKIEKAIQKALDLNPRQMHALAAQAWLTMYRDYDLHRAQRQFRECLDGCPDHAFARIGLATTCVLQHNFDEAKELALLSWRAEPLSPSVTYAIIRLYYWMGDLEQVYSATHVAASGYDSYCMQALGGLVAILTGRNELAVKEMQAAARVYPWSISIKAVLGFAYAIANCHLEARHILSGLMMEYSKATYYKVSMAYAIALIYCGLNDREQALHWLEKGSMNWSIFNLTIEFSPEFFTLRDDLRFLAILKSRGQRHRLPNAGG